MKESRSSAWTLPLLSPAVWVLLIPPLLLLLPPIFRGEIFFHEDLEYYFYALRGQLRTFWLQGAVQGWNPYTACGMPLLADIQLAPLYPPNLLFYWLPTGLAFNLSFLLHFCLGSWLSFRFLRALERSVPAAVLGTLIFLWSGFFWAHLHHVTFLHAGIWLPAMLYGWERVRRGQGGALGVAIPIAMSALAGGSPQILYYSLLVLGSYALFTTFSGPVRSEVVPPPSAGNTARHWAWLTVAGVLGLGASAVQGYPFYLATLEKFHEPLSALEYSSSFALPPLSLGRTLVPNLFGNDFYGLNGVGFQGTSTYWESWCYLGILTLPLLVMGRARRGREAYFTGLLVVCFLGSLGTLGGLHYLLVEILPGYDRFRAPSRLWMLIGLSAAVLASRALDTLRAVLDRPELATLEVTGRPLPHFAQRLRRVSKFTLVLGLELWGLCGLALFLRDTPLHPVATWGWGLALLNLLLAVAYLRHAASSLERSAGTDSAFMIPEARSRGTRFAWAAVALLLADLLPVLWTYNHTVPAAEATQVPEVVTQVKTALQGSPGRVRVLVDRSAPLYLLNGGLEFGFPTVRGYNPLNPGRIQQFLEAVDRSEPRQGGISLLVNDLQDPMLTLLAPELLITREEQPSDRYDLLWQDKTKGMSLYRDRMALPRAWLTGELRQVLSTPMALAAARESRLESPPFVAVREDAVPLPKLDAHATDPSSITWITDRPDRLELEVEVSGRAGLVLADTFASGWTAQVNGSPTTLYPAFEALRLVILPASGRHRVTFQYQTPGLMEGAVVSGVCLFLLMGMGGGLLLRRRSSLARRPATFDRP